MHRFQPRSLIKHLAVVATLVATATMLTAVAQGHPDLVVQSMRDRPFVGGEMLVQFRRGASDADKDAVLHGLGARIVDDVLLGSARNDGKGDLHLLRLPVGLAVAAALREAGRAPTVDFAEPNWIYYSSVILNDPYYTNGSLWGMYGDASNPANQYGSQAGEAWAAKGGDCGTVVVGVIDEGIMVSHPDLANNIWVNPIDTGSGGVDNDGNGYIDDVNGWDFDGNNNTVFDGVGDDHGTHVAGTIGAMGGNGTGVAGACWSVKLISAKFLGSAGGTTANAIKAVDYITDLKKRHNLNLVATNNSWGGGGFSQALKDAIDRAGVASILFVAAAGNSTANNDVTPSYPSSYTSDNIISVASITNTGAISSFSNYGATSVDLGAPGSGIWSTVPARSNKGKVVSSYASYSGTSMATPHVTGAVALYAARNVGTAAQIKTAILLSVVPTASLLGKTVTNGRLNVSGF